MFHVYALVDKRLHMKHCYICGDYCNYKQNTDVDSLRIFGRFGKSLRHLVSQVCAISFSLDMAFYFAQCKFKRSFCAPF